MALDLRKEKDPEILRKAALLLERENQKLVREIAKLLQEITALRGGDGADAARRVEQLELQLARLQKDLFGPKSERSSAMPDDNGKPPPAKKKGHGRRAQPLLPLISRTYELDEADRLCTQCGRHLEVFAGQAERSNEVHVVRRVFINVEHVQQKYRCPNGCCIETAPGPRKLFRGARYSIGFALEVAIQKYLFHMPLARQVRQMRGEGLEIDTQTLWDQLEKLATILGPAYERVRAFVISHAVVGADETKWRMMGKAGPDADIGKLWQVWTLAVPQAVYYRIQDSRSHLAAMNMLEGFKGVVMCDGYKAYNLAAEKLGGVLIANCWSHVRRAFKDIEGFFPQDTEKILDLINELFAIERLVPATDDPDTLAARRVLRAQRGDAPGPLFVPVLKGGAVQTRRLRDQAVFDLLRRMASKSKVAAFSPHDLRRTFVGDLLDRGADIATVQKLAGHASVSTTARYDRRGEATKRRVSEMLHVPFGS